MTEVLQSPQQSETSCCPWIVDIRAEICQWNPLAEMQSLSKHKDRSWISDSAPPQRSGCATRQWHVVSLPPRRGWWPPFSEGLATTLLHAGRDNRTMWRCWHLDSLLFIAVCQHLAQIVDFFQEHVILRPSENSGNQSGINTSQISLLHRQPWRCSSLIGMLKPAAAPAKQTGLLLAYWVLQTSQHVPTVVFQACCVHSLSPKKEWLALCCHPHGLPSLLHVRKKEAFPCSTGQTRGQIWVTSCVQPSFPLDYISFRYHIYTHTPSSLTHSPWTIWSKSFMVLVFKGW